MSDRVRTLRREEDFEEATDDIALDPRSANGHGPRPALVSLDEFAQGERETTLRVEIDGGKVVKVWVSYDPNLISDATDNRVQDLAEAGDDLAAARVFCEVVHDWNLAGPMVALLPDTDDDGEIVFDDAANPVMRKRTLVKSGEKVPLDPEIVQHLRSGVVLGFWKALREDAYGVPTNRAARRKQLRQSRNQSRRP